MKKICQCHHWICSSITDSVYRKAQRITCEPGVLQWGGYHGFLLLPPAISVWVVAIDGWKEGRNEAGWETCHSPICCFYCRKSNLLSNYLWWPSCSFTKKMILFRCVHDSLLSSCDGHYRLMVQGEKLNGGKKREQKRGRNVKHLNWILSYAVEGLQGRLYVRFFWSFFWEGVFSYWQSVVLFMTSWIGWLLISGGLLHFIVMLA